MIFILATMLTVGIWHSYAFTLFAIQDWARIWLFAVPGIVLAVVYAYLCRNNITFYHPPQTNSAAR